MQATKYSFNENTSELDVDPQFIADGVSFAKRKNYTAIKIIALNGCRGKTCDLDLTPLSGNNSISSLHVSDNFKVARANIDAMYSMGGLTKLTFRDKKIKPDFSRLPRLEVLYMQYNGIPSGLSSLKKLTHLMVISLTNKDCLFLSDLAALTQLRISGGTVETLAGVEKLQNLVDVRVDHCAKLKDISPLRMLKRLAILHVEKCKNLDDYSFLAGNDSIETMALSDVNSLAFAASLKRLSSLQFWDLKDGDLSPLLKVKSLKKVHFYPEKKHYSHTRAEINSFLGVHLP